MPPIGPGMPCPARSAGPSCTCSACVAPTHTQQPGSKPVSTVQAGCAAAAAQHQPAPCFCMTQHHQHVSEGCLSPAKAEALHAHAQAIFMPAMTVHQTTFPIPGTMSNPRAWLGRPTDQATSPTHSSPGLEPHTCPSALRPHPHAPVWQPSQASYAHPSQPTTHRLHPESEGTVVLPLLCCWHISLRSPPHLLNHQQPRPSTSLISPTPASTADAASQLSLCCPAAFDLASACCRCPSLCGYSPTGYGAVGALGPHEFLGVSHQSFAKVHVWFWQLDGLGSFGLQALCIFETPSLIQIPGSHEWQTRLW